MNTLQKALHQQIEKLPRQFISELLDKKLRAHGIRLSKRKCQQLLAKILDEGVEIHSIDLGKGRTVSKGVVIEFDEADSAEVEGKFTRFMSELPAIIRNTADRISRLILRDLKRKWKDQSAWEQKQTAGFRRRLQTRWRVGLGKLRMLLTIAREFGSDVNAELSATPGAPGQKTAEILIKLHARAVQVADEVLCLLEGGFADGAMARWRTLHEIAAVGYLIQKHGDDLAQRYQDHELVESRKAALQFARFQERLGAEPIPDETLQRMEAEYGALLGQYGRPFASPQGWAAKHLGKASPTIADIQEAAGIDHLAPYYRLASHNVHANPKGVFFKLGLIGESRILLSGPSNAGLADPGHTMALSLVQISSALLQLHPSLDNTVVLNVMDALAEEVGVALLVAHKKLEVDAKRFDAKRGTRNSESVR
jgi:uncharacterized protein DUF5677